MKFLVVDDSATMRRIVVNSLQRIGFANVLEAPSGIEALKAFDDSIGFIITDWNMPNMSGLDLARAVRAHADGASVPILMVTTRSMKKDIVTAIDAGVSSYVEKPFTPQVLKERIDQLVGTNGARPPSHAS